MNTNNQNEIILYQPDNSLKLEVKEYLTTAAVVRPVRDAMSVENECFLWASVPSGRDVRGITKFGHKREHCFIMTRTCRPYGTEKNGIFFSTDIASLTGRNLQSHKKQNPSFSPCVQFIPFWNILPVVKECLTTATDDTP